MTAALSRKRSRLGLDSDDEELQRRREPSPALSAASDTLKKTRTQCELDELGVISPDEAWTLDVDALLASPSLSRQVDSRLEAHSNWANYRKGESLIVLCVQGNVQTHYELLCSALPDLYNLAPTLQSFVLCHEPATHRLSTLAPFSLPLIQGVTPSNNHFVRLGLLHPLGGGKFPLDALVVLDTQGRRRLVLPFGWGAGKHASTPAGRGIQTTLMTILRDCIRTLECER